MQKNAEECRRMQKNAEESRRMQTKVDSLRLTKQPQLIGKDK
jgi:hypothetical protein